MDINANYEKREDIDNKFLVTLGFTEEQVDEYRIYMQNELNKITKSGKTLSASLIIELSIRHIFKRYGIEREPTLDEICLFTVAQYVGKNAVIKRKKDEELSELADILKQIRKYKR